MPGASSTSPAPSSRRKGRRGARRHVARAGFATVPLAACLAGFAGPAVFVPQVAMAATPGNWQSLGTTPSTMTPVVFETPSHDAYVLWTKGLGPNSFTYDVAEVSPMGDLLAGPTSIFGPHYWGSLSVQPTIVGQGGAPLVVFDGARSTSPADPYSKSCIVGALGPGLPWALQPWSLSASCVNPVGAASVDNSGQLSAAWPGGWPTGHGILYHMGQSPGIPAASPDQHIALGGPAVAGHVAMATDRAGNGHTYVAWAQTGSSGAAQDGYYAKDLTANGPVVRVPGSGSRSANISPFAVPAMANSLSHPGVFVAYCSNAPSCNVELWKLGSAKALTVPGSSGAADTAVSAGPDGRIWVAWYNESKNTVSLVRTNKSVTLFGPVTTLATPCAEHGLIGLGPGQWGRSDIALQCVDQQLKIEDLFTQAIVPLALGPSHVTVVAGKAKQVVFRVTDAGDPVAGATVKVGTHLARTNAGGTVTVTFSKTSTPGSYSVTASGPNYRPATGVVVVSEPAH